MAIGSSAVCLEWSTARALAAGATEDEIADVLLAIAPVAGLGRVVSAAPDVATALGYDIEAALRNWTITDLSKVRTAPDPAGQDMDELGRRVAGHGLGRDRRLNNPRPRDLSRMHSSHLTEIYGSLS